MRSIYSFVLLILFSTFSLAGTPATFESVQTPEPDKEVTPLKCGGQFKNEDLNFTYNPITKSYSAYSSDDDLMVFIQPAKYPGFKIIILESIEPALQDEIGAKIKDLAFDMQKVIKASVSKKITTLYAAMFDGMLHIEVQRADKPYTLSCVPLTEN